MTARIPPPDPDSNRTEEAICHFDAGNNEQRDQKITSEMELFSPSRERISRTTQLDSKERKKLSSRENLLCSSSSPTFEWNTFSFSSPSPSCPRGFILPTDVNGAPGEREGISAHNRLFRFSGSDFFGRRRGAISFAWIHEEIPPWKIAG